MAVADGLAPALPAPPEPCAGWTPAQLASYLRGKDARVLLPKVLAKGLTGSGPIPDSVVVSADPIAEIGAGRNQKVQKVPVLSAYTAEESKRFLSRAMMDSLRAFVHTGDPNNATLGQTWQPWPRKFIFDADQKAVRLSVQ